ncbi:uncharacterized protein K452DRAFT_283142 [Aplosporella prunicola CBS 121167]|uniref:Endoplasmic oxidoreductin n=1 Tax=Aplosporella prunicola CBS 121167 TaxID=1176127 RepID=A0A6A6BUD7_9PEZI|nr:uncharacterized protein K452DRAFT_283142 [Aplosporella prunicola CBS 121167]KAF2146943.1 hypothetical protein K452DRAFT_283142 [Aplosporella prunicola CBS 121167]
MRPAAHVFYLAVFALLGTSNGASHSSAKPKAKADECAFEPGAIVSDACASYASLEELNDQLSPHLQKITRGTDYFSYYRLNLYNKKCPFWSDENGMCGNIACAVNTLDNEEDIPLVWRAEELGKLEGPKAVHPGRKVREERRNQKPLQGKLGEGVGESCVVEYDDECDERDYCVPEDESAASKGDYVSLLDNPERFTGYAGMGSQQVWEAIYRENCFSKPKGDEQISPVGGMGLGSSSPFGVAGGGLTGGQGQAAQDLRNVMRSQPLQRHVQSAIAQGNKPPARVDQLEFEDDCVEKRVFYRVVSGMHASITTHLCYEHMNQTTGTWGPNLACYEKRLHGFPDRISNLYFNYALVLRAVGKLQNYWKNYEFCAADPSQNAETKDLVLSLSSAIPENQKDSIFDEGVMFQGDHALLKEDFRDRFRNVSRVMDCVGCDKCRLWGKLQTAGYGTALKVLFEFDENELDQTKNPPLRRTELVALMNTFGRVSHSLGAIKHFRQMIEERDNPTPKAEAEAKKDQSEVDADAPLPPHVRDALADAPAVPSEQQREQRDREAAARRQAYLDNDSDEPEFLRRRRMRRTTGVWDSIKVESQLVWDATCWVLNQWVNAPAKFFNIAVFEISRLWDYWLGLPVKPRGWEVRFPGWRNEL